MLVHRESAVFAGTAVAAPPADEAPMQAHRPFGPFPRGVVALYGTTLAGSGLTLCFMAGRPDAFWAAGANALLGGLWCVGLSVRRGRGPQEASDVEPITATEPEDAGRVAARVVGELDDLRHQLDELSEQCEAYTGIVAARMVSELEDLRRQLDEVTPQPEVVDVLSAEASSAAARQWAASDHRIQPAGSRSVLIALPALVVTAVIGRVAWGRTRH